MSSTTKPIQVPFPLSTFPGANPQEGSGRLINCYSEPLGEATRPTGPAPQVWRRSPGLTRFAKGSASGFRGGLEVPQGTFNACVEVFANNAFLLTSGGSLTLLGTLAGTSKVSIAQNLRTGANAPDVVVVDPGTSAAYNVTTSGGVFFYTGGGNLPPPNSVCFQDGYFFFTIVDGRCFASGINALTQNALTFINVQAKADVTLLRAVAYSGLLWLFTTGHCEIWQDTAQPFPAFPYSRLTVLERGLLQSGAIAGFETGFSELAWVGQDFGVWWSTPGSQAPIKISSPDLEKLIQTQNTLGNTLDAWVYGFAGKKFWVLSSPDWTWEFNFTTQRWHERSSLSGGLQGQYRATGSHLAFGQWLTGDRQSGDILFIDTTVSDECGTPQLFRMESGPVKDFPNQIRVARADFDWTMGTGQNVGTMPQHILSTTIGAATLVGTNLVRIQVMDTRRMQANDTVNITGNAIANGTWQINIVDDQNIDLQGSTYPGGSANGTLIDITSPPNVVAPQVAISMSKDGGLNFGNPLLRQFGRQQKSLRNRTSVKNMGLSGPMGDRWRLDVTDAVYTALIGGTQSSDPREVGA